MQHDDSSQSGGGREEERTIGVGKVMIVGITEGRREDGIQFLESNVRPTREDRVGQLPDLGATRTNSGVKL